MSSTPCWLCGWFQIMVNIHDFFVVVFLLFSKNIISKFLSILKSKHFINLSLISKRKLMIGRNKAVLQFSQIFFYWLFLKQPKKILSSPSSSRNLFLFFCPCRQSYDTKSHAAVQTTAGWSRSRKKGRKKEGEREKEGTPQDEEAERKNEGMTNREKRRQTQDG